MALHEHLYAPFFDYDTFILLYALLVVVTLTSAVDTLVICRDSVAALRSALLFCLSILSYTLVMLSWASPYAALYANLLGLVFLICAIWSWFIVRTKHAAKKQP